MGSPGGNTATGLATTEIQTYNLYYEEITDYAMLAKFRSDQ